jgi:putative oxidoreductase
MNWSKAESIAYTLLRVVAGWLFFQAGATKILGWFGGVPPGVTIAVGSQAWIGGMLEMIGGPLILIGLFTRPAAFIVSGEMAVAYFQFHQPNGTWPHQNQGTGAVLFCFIFLYMAAKGGGEYSLDAFLRKR